MSHTHITEYAFIFAGVLNLTSETSGSTYESDIESSLNVQR